MACRRLMSTGIGAGVAGIVASYILQRKYDVSLFEKNQYLGGHTNTIVIEAGPDKGLPVDTGFIVLNDKTYPLFNQFLNQLNVKTRISDMSFSYYDQRDQFQFAGTNLNGLFAQRKHFFSPSCYQLLAGIKKFSKHALNDLENHRFNGETLGQYIERIKIPDISTQRYMIPMGGAIWSASEKDILDYPAESFVRFFKNHGLLSLKDILEWKTVVGGSHSYVKAFEQQFRGEIHLNAEIDYVRRKDNQIILRMSDGTEQCYDDVVLATHAAESLLLLFDPTDEEKERLGAWNYSKNHTILHTDTTVLPSLKRAWASWNYIRYDDQSGQSGSVTYHMNRLQGLNTERDYCVTLNGSQLVSPDKIIKEIIYTHPIFTTESLSSQAALPQLNGKNNTYFCGSYFGYGFHEDAVKSAVDVAREMGLSL